jgi:hypothetical protein
LPTKLTSDIKGTNIADLGKYMCQNAVAQSDEKINEKPNDPCHALQCNPGNL